MRWIWAVIGVLLLGAGAVFTLQGLGYVKGSVMTGSLTWAIIGPIIALAGLALMWYGLRRRARAA